MMMVRKGQHLYTYCVQLVHRDLCHSAFLLQFRSGPLCQDKRDRLFETAPDTSCVDGILGWALRPTFSQGLQPQSSRVANGKAIASN